MTLTKVTPAVVGDSQHAGGDQWNELVDINTSPIKGYSWQIYKQGSDYKARSGYLGTVPTGAISTSLDAVLSYIKSNFNQTGEEAVGGLIQFNKGIFTYTGANGFLLDNTYGNTVNGLIVQGHRYGTLLRYQPAVRPEDSDPLDSAIRIANVRETVFRDIDIELNNNANKGIVIDARGLNSTSGGTTRGVVQNVRIINSNNNVIAVRNSGSDQIGIYIVSDNPAGASAATHWNLVDNIYIQGLDNAINATTLSTANKNTSGLTFRDITMWDCRRGIKVGDYSHSVTIDGVKFQDILDGGIGQADYAVSLGRESDYCHIFDIQVDKMSKLGSACVILNGDARYNKIIDCINTGGHQVLDYSGNSTNEILNMIGFGVPSIHGRSRMGMLAGNSLINGDGYFAAPDAFTIVGTSPTLGHFDNDEGIGVTCATSTAVNNQSGIIGTRVFTKRRSSPLYTIRFKLSNIDNQRLWILLTNSLTAPPINNTYTDAIPCIGLAIRSTDTNFQIIRNNNVGSAVFSDALDNAGVAQPIATTRKELRTGVSLTHAHELWILGDNTNARWLISLDRAIPQAFNSDIPAVDDLLSIQSVIETTVGGNTRTMNYYQQKLVTSR